jgi:hypothetical protein
VRLLCLLAAAKINVLRRGRAQATIFSSEPIRLEGNFCSNSGRRDEDGVASAICIELLRFLSLLRQLRADFFIFGVGPK